MCTLFKKINLNTLFFPSFDNKKFAIHRGLNSSNLPLAATPILRIEGDKFVSENDANFCIPTSISKKLGMQKMASFLITGKFGAPPRQR